MLPIIHFSSIGECPSISQFLKNNGAEASKGQRPIVFKEWRETRTITLHSLKIMESFDNRFTKQVDFNMHELLAFTFTFIKHRIDCNEK